MGMSQDMSSGPAASPHKVRMRDWLFLRLGLGLGLAIVAVSLGVYIFIIVPSAQELLESETVNASEKLRIQGQEIIDDLERELSIGASHLQGKWGSSTTCSWPPWSSFPRSRGWCWRPGRVPAAVS